MGTKLTLYIEDEAVVARAKTYAAQQHTSLSKLVSQYLASLTYAPQDDVLTRLHTRLRAQDFQAPTDEELQAARDQHLQAKYGLPLAPPSHQRPGRHGR